jgi:hypothetical protein
VGLELNAVVLHSGILAWRVSGPITPSARQGQLAFRPRPGWVRSSQAGGQVQSLADNRGLSARAVEPGQALGQFGAVFGSRLVQHHQSFQQMVTAAEVLRAAQGDCLVVIEDTCTSLMREFSRHGDRTFLDYAKASTDILVSKINGLFPDQMPAVDPSEALDIFSRIYSTQFYSGIVAFKVDAAAHDVPRLIWNRQPTQVATDFRYEGVASARVDWPSPFAMETVVVNGGKA